MREQKISKMRRTTTRHRGEGGVETENKKYTIAAEQLPRKSAGHRRFRRPAAANEDDEEMSTSAAPPFPTSHSPLASSPQPPPPPSETNPRPAYGRVGRGVCPQARTAIF